MNNPYDHNSDDLDELLRQVDRLLEDPPAEPDDGIDLAEYTPQGLDSDEPIFYQNYANRYGANVRNYANGYGSGQQASQPRPAPAKPSQPAPRQAQPRKNRYPEEFDAPRKSMAQRAVLREDRDYDPAPERKRNKRRGCCGCGCLSVLTTLALLMTAVVAAFFLLFEAPQSDDPIGVRKDDTAAILVCGTDEDGTRTDTMMLLYLSGSENRVSLLSLPRDSYTITSAGKAAKLNSAYGRNGTGEAGMEAVMDYVQDIIGYRPDGYVLVDFTLVPQIVDIMGGVDFEVPMDMEVASVALEAGYQHLTGRQLMTLLRFRKGYATADLGRVEMQRTVLKACMEQWLTPAHIGDALEAVSLLESGSISTLELPNYLWIAKTLLTGMGNFSNDTLPGYADYIGDTSYYLLDRAEIAELINTSYNPYEVTISPEDLNIAE